MNKRIEQDLALSLSTARGSDINFAENIHHVFPSHKTKVEKKVCFILTFPLVSWAGVVAVTAFVKCTIGK